MKHFVTAKDVTKKSGKFTSIGRVFHTDQYGSVYEDHGSHSLFFCKLNGRKAKEAISDKLDAEYYE